MFAVYVSYELVETIFGGRIHLQKVYWVCQGHVYPTEFAKSSQHFEFFHAQVACMIRTLKRVLSSVDLFIL